MSASRKGEVLRIGVDFDNTIVNYDALFHRVAFEQGLIPENLAPTKLAVRDHLRRIDREDRWTELQGYVYGARMGDADMYPGAREFFAWARDRGISPYIVSHKTRHPFLGPQYDLHAAARAWVETALADERGRLVQMDRVFFELTQEDKIRRIADLDCDLYVDDLPEVLQDSAFPPGIERILFDPERHHRDLDGVIVAATWRQIQDHVERRWLPNR